MTFPFRRARFFQGWGGVAVALAAGALVLRLTPAGLSTPAVRFLAILVVAAILWARGRPADYVVAVGMGLAWILLGSRQPGTPSPDSPAARGS